MRKKEKCLIDCPSGVIIDLSVRLEFVCTNNQAKYDSLLHGLEYLRDLGARDVDVFGDSNQCLDGVLNSY
jgi:ribonuclease HI